MPLQNRADPFGLLHAVPQRGGFMGNRGGGFHREGRTLKDRQWASQRWIICRLEFKGRRRKLMQPGLYTELFFLDEATALAGGHRPCFECRRPDAEAFRRAVVKAGFVPHATSAGDIDALCAGEIGEVLAGRAARETIDPAQLPDGAMYAMGGAACLVHESHARAWSFSGYGPPLPLHPAGLRLTPKIVCAAINSGYHAGLHASIGSV